MAIPNSELDVQYAVSNLGLASEISLWAGVDGTQRFVDQIGADGISLLPRRSRLTAEIAMAYAATEITRDEDSRAAFDGPEASLIRPTQWAHKIGGLVIAMEQSYGATLGQGIARFFERSDLSYKERAKRLGVNALEAVGLPAVHPSLRSLQHVARMSANPNLYATVYAEELRPGQKYTDDDLACTRICQLTPDAMERLNANDIEQLIYMLNDRGVTDAGSSQQPKVKFSINPYNMYRSSEHGRILPINRDVWLSRLAMLGHVREFRLSLNRGDLPQGTGPEAAQRTVTLAEELLQDNPLGEATDRAANIAATILENSPGGHLTVVVGGDLRTYSVAQIQQIMGNVKDLVSRPTAA